MNKELRSWINKEFPLEPRTDYRLSDAIIEDDYGSESGAFPEDWSNWQEIPDWQVAKCYVLFSYAPKEAMNYLLPRYMIFCLDQIDGNIDENIYQKCTDVSGEHAVSYIKELKKSDYVGSGFSEIQIGILEAFLVYVHESW